MHKFYRWALLVMEHSGVPTSFANTVDVNNFSFRSPDNAYNRSDLLPSFNVAGDFSIAERVCAATASPTSPRRTRSISGVDWPARRRRSISCTTCVRRSAWRLAAPRASGTMGSPACHAHSVRNASVRTLPASSSSASPRSALARAATGLPGAPTRTRICSARTRMSSWLVRSASSARSSSAAGRPRRRPGERVEREAADVGVGVVEQPREPRGEPIVLGPRGDREHEVAGGAAAQRGIGLARELEDRADGARIADGEQARGAADRGVGAPARELREQGLELVVAEGPAVVGGDPGSRPSCCASCCAVCWRLGHARGARGPRAAAAAAGRRRTPRCGRRPAGHRTRPRSAGARRSRRSRRPRPGRGGAAPRRGCPRCRASAVRTASTGSAAS